MGGIADVAGMQVSMLIGAGIPLLVSFAVGIIQFRKRALIK